MKAAFYKRVLAWFIDRIFISIVFIIASILILGPYNFSGPLGQAIVAMDSSKNIAIEFIRTAYNFYLFFILLYLLSNRTYYFLFEVFSGQTIGKKILHLQITNLDGNKPKIIKFFFRSLIYVVAYFLIYRLSSSIGNLQNWMYIIITNAVLYSTILFTPEKQTLYELLSSLKVINEDKIVTEEHVNTIVKSSDSEKKIYEKHDRIIFNKYIDKKKIIKIISFSSLAIYFIIIISNYAVYQNKHAEYRTYIKNWEQQEYSKKLIQFKHDIKIYNDSLYIYNLKVNSYSTDSISYSLKLKSYYKERSENRKKESIYNIKLNKWSRNLSEHNRQIFYSLKYKYNYRFLWSSEEKDWYKSLKGPIEPYGYGLYEQVLTNLLTYPIKPTYPQKAKMTYFPSYETYNKISIDFFNTLLIRNPVYNLLPYFIILAACFVYLSLLYFTIYKFQHYTSKFFFRFSIIFTLIIFFVFLIFNLFTTSVNSTLELYNSVLLHISLISFSLMIFIIGNFIYTKLKPKLNNYFPLNKGMNRLLLVLFCILTIYSIMKGQIWPIAIFLICYPVFLWIYNGFKESKEREIRN